VMLLSIDYLETKYRGPSQRNKTIIYGMRIEEFCFGSRYSIGQETGRRTEDFSLC
jgi:hypothetical protein